MNPVIQMHAVICAIFYLCIIFKDGLNWNTERSTRITKLNLCIWAFMLGFCYLYVHRCESHTFTLSAGIKSHGLLKLLLFWLSNPGNETCNNYSVSLSWRNNVIFYNYVCCKY